MLDLELSKIPKLAISKIVEEMEDVKTELDNLIEFDFPKIPKSVFAGKILHCAFK